MFPRSLWLFPRSAGRVGWPFPWTLHPCSFKWFLHNIYQSLNKSVNLTKKFQTRATTRYHPNKRVAKNGTYILSEVTDSPNPFPCIQLQIASVFFFVWIYCLSGSFSFTQDGPRGGKQQIRSHLKVFLFNSIDAFLYDTDFTV